jgi:hypothetical protein
MPEKLGQRGGHDAAVVGVVIAGVLSSFVIPGPFDWGSFLIGLLLLAVLIGYADVPNSKDHWRWAVAGAAAVAFCLLLILGATLDQWERTDGNGHRVHVLSGWPAEAVDGDNDPATPPDLPTREDADRPNANDGLSLLIIWLGLSGVIYAVWRLWWVPRTAAPTTGPD